MEVDRSQAERFIINLTGDDSAPTSLELDWATFHDNEDLNPDSPVFRVRGTLVTVWDKLIKANKQGSGVFVTINESNGKSFLDLDIIRIRAIFIDDDGNDPPVTRDSIKHRLDPSTTVQSCHGQHNYFLVAAGETTDDFTHIQKSLAKKFDTDKTICNLGRVMRLPGTIHMKDPTKPFLVKLLRADDTEYTLKEIVEAFEILPTPVMKKAAKERAKATPDVEEERVKRARAYIAKMGPAVQGDGGDQHTFKVASVLVRDFDLDDDRALPLFQEWNETCRPQWSEEDLETKLVNARAYSKKDAGNKLVDYSHLREAIIRSGTTVAAVETYRPIRPLWENGQFAANKGPLVHYVPSGKKEGDQWIQTQPTGQMIANAAEDLVRYCNTTVFSYAGFGSRYFSISDRNIATPTTRELLMPDVRELCKSMMAGFAPTPETFTTAEQHLRAMPYKGSDLPQLRWEGEKHMALHELPLPAEGDWSAHQEFISRVSCAETVMAWTWTCFLPVKETGREALLFFGKGQDGKSYWCETLMRFLGPVATASEILKGENRFELANLLNKRLAYFGDFRNPRPIHSKIMREIISGAYLFTEGKGKDGQSFYFHPRCLLTTNVEPRISRSDRAEYTRIRRVNVDSIPDNQGDQNWPEKLLAQMPAFLFECRKVYERMMKGRAGQDLPITPACVEALKGGEAALAEDFDYLAERLEVTGVADDVVSSRRLSELMEKAHYKEWVRKDAYRWLRSQGATNKQEDGTDVYITVKKGDKSVRGWTGIKEREGGSRFEGVGN